MDMRLWFVFCVRMVPGVVVEIVVCGANVSLPMEFFYVLLLGGLSASYTSIS